MISRNSHFMECRNQNFLLMKNTCYYKNHDSGRPELRLFQNKNCKNPYQQCQQFNKLEFSRVQSVKIHNSSLIS